MELKVNDYFEDSKRRNREEFRERVRQIKAQRHEFLNIFYLSTLLFWDSVGLRAATGEPNTNPTLVIAWSIQILVLVLGTTVIKAQLDSDEYRRERLRFSDRYGGNTSDGGTRLLCDRWRNETDS